MKATHFKLKNEKGKRGRVKKKSQAKSRMTRLPIPVRTNKFPIYGNPLRRLQISMENGREEKGDWKLRNPKFISPSKLCPTQTIMGSSRDEEWHLKLKKKGFKWENMAMVQIFFPRHPDNGNEEFPQLKHRRRGKVKSGRENGGEMKQRGGSYKSFLSPARLS